MSVRAQADAGSLPANAGRFEHHAMATVFEIVVVHDDLTYAAQCAHEAFREVDRLEQVLSRFVENSDISRINKAPVGEPVRVGLDAFECLRHCAELADATGGAHDITLGALVDEWGERSLAGPAPDAPEAGARKAGDPASVDQAAEGAAAINAQSLELDESRHTVARLREDVSLDLGGFGKGYAVDCMAAVLADWDIDNALLHGGTSSVLALEAPPGARGWQVTVRDPAAPDEVIDTVFLRRMAMSGSGLRKGQHIIDPRTRRPATATRAAWAVTDNAAVSDALSTAFMIMSTAEIVAFCKEHEATRAIVIPAGRPPRFVP